MEFGPILRCSSSMVTKNRPVKRLIETYEAGEGRAQIVESPSQLSSILWRAFKGELGRRNVAITMMLFGSGMRINEVAQLTIKDLLRPNGELKGTFILPGKYTKTGKSRVVYIVVPQQIEALDLWLAERIYEKAMASGEDTYRGLIPDSPLFLSKKGKNWRKFAFNAKRYKTKEGMKETLVCSSLENLMRDIIKGAGLQGGSSHSGRRSLATWLDRKGCALEVIQDILNHEDPDMSLVYVEPWQRRIEQAYKNSLKGVKMPEALK